MSIERFLPSKLRTFLISDLAKKDPSMQTIQQELDGSVSTWSNSKLKDNIFDAGKYILKSVRTDLVTHPSSHLYRIRKAEKVRSFINKNNLSDSFVVPNKYVYIPSASNHIRPTSKDEAFRHCYTVVEKLEIDDAVVAVSPQLEQELKAFSLNEGQIKKLKDNPAIKKIALTDKQVAGLAKLAFLGLTDLTYNNFFFTKDGRFAILDTEPQKRALHKRVFSNFFTSVFGIKSSFKIQNSLTGSAKLKLFCSEEQIKVVSKIERYHVLWNLALNIAKIATCISLIVFLPQVVAAAGLSGLAISIAVVSTNATLGLKCFFIFSNTLSTVFMWNLSYNLNIGLIAYLEQQGIC